MPTHMLTEGCNWSHAAAPPEHVQRVNPFGLVMLPHVLSLFNVSSAMLFRLHEWRKFQIIVSEQFLTQQAQA